MKVTCPGCQAKINVKDIKNIKKKGIYVEKQCPSCHVWFSLNTTLAFAKMLGVSLLLVTSLLNLSGTKSEYSLLFSSLGFVGVVVALLVTFFGKNETVKKPNN
ncbi:hypothetical protein [Psychromonas sp. SP041]|uniref:hypothetical protein n=1 Tax=Psychromonas sp. SP041 TaxID=1365007 RepID=UPI0004196AAE|nr:hypothetical protein [Psychromonas sp. SP041]